MTLIDEIRSGRKDLRGADLYGADLRGADLHEADLRCADLRGADLRCADLRGDLYGADLRGADLHGANLRGADLRGADLRCADLRGADLRCADLRGDLYGADLRGADLHGANLRGADLRGADLRGADLRGACFGGLALDGLPSGRALLIPTCDGWVLQIGCWTGTTASLRTMIAGTDWPESRGAEQDRRRPGLMALAGLCDVHAAAHQHVIDDLIERWGAAA